MQDTAFEVQWPLLQPFPLPRMLLPRPWPSVIAQPRYGRRLVIVRRQSHHHQAKQIWDSLLLSFFSCQIKGLYVIVVI